MPAFTSEADIGAAHRPVGDGPISLVIVSLQKQGQTSNVTARSLRPVWMDASVCSSNKVNVRLKYCGILVTLQQNTLFLQLPSRELMIEPHLKV
jgi:hypothetical protein